MVGRRIEIALEDAARIPTEDHPIGELDPRARASIGLKVDERADRPSGEALTRRFCRRGSGLGRALALHHMAAASAELKIRGNLGATLRALRRSRSSFHPLSRRGRAKLILLTRNITRQLAATSEAEFIVVLVFFSALRVDDHFGLLW